MIDNLLQEPMPTWLYGLSIPDLIEATFGARQWRRLELWQELASLELEQSEEQPAC